MLRCCFELLENNSPLMIHSILSPCGTDQGLGPPLKQMASIDTIHLPLCPKLSDSMLHYTTTKAHGFHRLRLDFDDRHPELCYEDIGRRSSHRRQCHVMRHWLRHNRTTSTGTTSDIIFGHNYSHPKQGDCI
jgi:hypothetical protein